MLSYPVACFHAFCLYLDFSLDTFIAGVCMETRKGSAPSTECDARHCRAREEHTPSQMLILLQILNPSKLTLRLYGSEIINTHIGLPHGPARSTTSMITKGDQGNDIFVLHRSNLSLMARFRPTRALVSGPSLGWRLIYSQSGYQHVSCVKITVRMGRNKLEYLSIAKLDLFYLLNNQLMVVGRLSLSNTPHTILEEAGRATYLRR